MRRGDDLPPLSLTGLVVAEAPPSPAPGPVRDALARAAARRAERAEALLADAVDGYADRVAGVVLARLRGPKARKGTRHWSDRTTAEKSRGPDAAATPTRTAATTGTTRTTTGIEVKALDAEYVVPDSLTGEAVETLRPVVMRIAHDAASDAGRRIKGAPGSPEGMFAVDSDLLNDLIDEALEDLLGAAERHAADLRQAIREGEAAGMDLDTLVDTVEQAAGRGDNWLRLNARTVATALAGKSALEQARAVGVTHTQWISRRDDRVRPTHVTADGQVRPVGAAFTVGGQHLEYPGDPSGLPGTAGEVHGCRCGLIFADPDQDFLDALIDIATAAVADGHADGVDPLLDAAAGSAVLVGMPPLAGLPVAAAAVPTPHPVVGWRQLDAVLAVVPGQHVRLPAGTVLGLAAPADLDEHTMAVLVPEATPVGVAGGALLLPDGADVQVLAAGDAGMQGRMTGL